MGRKLFVGNLPFQIAEAELQELFARVGQVESVQIMRDMATGRARGFAFVEMATEEEAVRAAEELNQAQVGGRTIAVNEARPRPPRTDGFGGGGGGRPGPGGGRGGGRRPGGGGGGGRPRREPRW